MLTPKDLTAATARMSAELSWYPPLITAGLTTFLLAMIGTADIPCRGRMWTPAERLEWLTDTLIQRIGKWPDEGMAFLRALYSQRFRTADGIQSSLGLPIEIEAALAPEEPAMLYLPRPGDEPVGRELAAGVARVAKRKAI